MLLLPPRRIHPRYSVQKIISYCHNEKRYLTLTLNLGLGGMKIKAHCDLADGEHMDFNLVLGDLTIGLKGRTVYSDSLPGGLMVSGIQFTELSEQDWGILEGYLAALEELPTKGLHCAGERPVKEAIKRKIA